MKEIIQFLYRNPSCSACFVKEQNTLIFSIYNFIFSIKFKHLERIDLFEDREIDEVEELLNNLSDIEFNSFHISFSENLEDRNTLLDVDFNYSTLFHEKCISIENSLILITKKIIELNGDLVLSYYTKVEDPFDNGMCGYHPEYIGEIEIDTNKLDLLVLNNILQILKKIEYIKIEDPYLSFITKTNLFKSKFSPQFLNTNTKVRRLGYLKLFFKLINDKKQIPESFVNKKFEDYALKYSSKLSEIANAKGVIQDLNGKSAEPYIKLLKEFDLITTVNRVIIPTKWLKTYLAINETIKENRTEAFRLDDVDSIFFIELILKKDFFYSIVILEFLLLKENTSAQEIIKSFQSLLLKRIKTLLNQEQHSNHQSHLKLKEIEKRISNWKKAEIYLEHIIMPRINWFADLNLVTLNDENKISINDNSKRLMKELNFWKDLATENIADSSEFLNLFYPHIYAKTFQDEVESEVEEEKINRLIDQYITQSFTIFRTLAPNRVTSSQAISYTKYCIYLKNRFPISENTIIKVLESNLSNKYIYKYQSRYGDGYIQRIITK